VPVAVVLDDADAAAEADDVGVAAGVPDADGGAPSDSEAVGDDVAVAVSVVDALAPVDSEADCDAADELVGVCVPEKDAAVALDVGVPAPVGDALDDGVGAALCVLVTLALAPSVTVSVEVAVAAAVPAAVRLAVGLAAAVGDAVAVPDGGMAQICTTRRTLFAPKSVTYDTRPFAELFHPSGDLK